MPVRNDTHLKSIKDLLGCVELIRRTRLRNIWITPGPPEVVIEVGISYLVAWAVGVLLVRWDGRLSPRFIPKAPQPPLAQVHVFLCS